MAFTNHNKSLHDNLTQTGYARAGVGKRHRFAIGPAKDEPKPKAKAPAKTPAEPQDDYAADAKISGLDAGDAGSGFGGAGLSEMDGASGVSKMGDPEEGDKGASTGGLDMPEMGTGAPFQHLHIHLAPAEHKAMKRMNARRK